MYRVLYFLQTDIICLVVLSLILITIIKKSDINKFLRMFKNTIISCMLFCIFDSIIYCLQQTNSIYIYEILLISNTIYFYLILEIGHYWNKFVNTKFLYNKSKLYKFISEDLFVIIGIILLLINLFTNCIFEIGINNTFIIKDYMFLLLIIIWSPIVLSAIKIIIYYFKTKSIVEKKKSLVMMLFILFPFICNTIQLINTNLSLTQVGLTISMLLIFLDYQQRLISLDSLTGINNRNYLNEYIDNLYKSTDKRVSIFVLDIDKFKKINDTYGHEIGDEVLKGVSTILTHACEIIHCNVKLIRFGGDEFVIIGNIDEENAKILINEINKNMHNINIQDIKVTLSIGYVLNKPIKDYTFKELLSLADKNMYEDKHRKQIKEK